MNDNKDEYRILLFLKDNVGFASVLMTIIGVSLTAIVNYLYYIMMYSYLAAWNIPGEYASNINTKQMIVIAMVFVLIVVNYIINRIMIYVADRIYLHDTLNHCYKNKIAYLLSISTNDHKRIHDYKHSVLPNGVFSEELKNIENEIDIVITELGDLKRQVRKTSIEIVLKYICGAALCSLISFGCCGALFYFLFENRFELIRTALLNSIPIFLFNMLYIFLLKIKSFSKDKRTLKLDEMDDEIAKVRSELAIARDSKPFLNCLNDKSIISFMNLLCAMIITLMILLPWSCRNSILNQSRFSIVNYEGTSYVLVYYDGTDLILKRCIVNNDSIKIDWNNYRIIESSDQEYQTMKFSNIDITELD